MILRTAKKSFIMVNLLVFISSFLFGFKVIAEEVSLKKLEKSYKESQESLEYTKMRLRKLPSSTG